jgi:hypothetical protein
VRRILGRPVARVEAAPARAIPSSQVYDVVCDDGSRFAVKAELNAVVGATGRADLLETEWQALSLLAARGCAVVQPVAVDRGARFLVTRWAEGPTLYDACQAVAGVDPGVAAACLKRLRAIERACAADADTHAPHAAPRDDAVLVDEFAAAFARAREAYYVCLDAGQSLAARTVRTCDEAWNELWVDLADAPIALGPVDVNARNLVLSPDGPVFLDFAAVGWDWPERRAAQYMTAMGRAGDRGRVACALTPNAVGMCPDFAARSTRRLEGHCLLTACLAVARLLDRAGPDEWPRWPDSGGARAESARLTLARGHVGESAPATALRAAVADGWRV